MPKIFLIFRVLNQLLYHCTSCVNRDGVRQRFFSERIVYQLRLFLSVHINELTLSNHSIHSVSLMTSNVHQILFQSFRSGIQQFRNSSQNNLIDTKATVLIIRVNELLSLE